MSDIALRVSEISKVYKLYEKQSDRLKEAFSPLRKSYHTDFYALNNISFSIKKGESIGIIGTNGSGKSTMLKIITGVLNQTSGEVETHGKIAALLELGAGFNQDYTGIENIYLNGTMMGYSKEEVDKRLKDIIEFADIGEFINQPVKSYSSGMFVRLAFATQIFSEPDILIVDEALSVGDIRFQQKCYRAMEELMKNKTVILVTHDTSAVAKFCKRVVWLEKGSLMFDGDVDEALKLYQGYLVKKSNDEMAQKWVNQFDEPKMVNTQIALGKESNYLPPIDESIKPNGNGDAIIVSCGLINNESNGTKDILEPGEKACFVAVVEFKRIVKKPLFGITVRDRVGNVSFDINNEMIGVDLPLGKERMEFRLSFQVPPLNKGVYTISAAVAEGEQVSHIQLCWLDDAWIFKIPNRKLDLPGLLYLDKGELDVFQCE